jgi:hypothetical protein
MLQMIATAINCSCCSIESLDNILGSAIVAIQHLETLEGLRQTAVFKIRWLAGAALPMKVHSRGDFQSSRPPPARAKRETSFMRRRG